MMQDYERVVELQEISQRSSGATMAQMATYLEGMDAAINKLRNSWEQIVTNLADNDAIINIINQFTSFLEKTAIWLEKESHVIGLIVTLSALLIINLTKK